MHINEINFLCRNIGHAYIHNTCYTLMQKQREKGNVNITTITDSPINKQPQHPDPFSSSLSSFGLFPSRVENSSNKLLTTKL